MEVHGSRRWRALLSAATLAAAVLLGACGAETAQSLLESGKQFEAKKDPKSAVIQYKAALQKDPNLVEARLLMGNALLAAGDPVSAAVELSKLLTENVPKDKFVPQLARAYLLLGEYKKLTLTLGDITLTEKPAIASLDTSLATAWAALGSRTKVDAAIAAALAADPDYGPALLFKARFAATEGDFDRAISMIDQIVARDPTFPDAWHLRGEVRLIGKHDAKGAAEDFAKAVQVDPTYVPAHTALIFLMLDKKDIAGAKAQAEKLRAVLPRHPQMMFLDATIAYRDGDLKKARELSQQLLKVAPDHVGVLMLAGAVEAQGGSLVQAATHFGRVTQLAPDNTASRIDLANVYLRLGQPAKALDALSRVLDSKTAPASAYALAGEAQLALGDARAAEESYERASKLAPGDTRTQTIAALARYSVGGSGDLSELERIAAQGKDTFADKVLVSALMKQQRLDDALKAVNALVAREPGNAGDLNLLGQVQLARRDYGAARQAFEAALRADPNLFVATLNLAALDTIDRKPDEARKRLEGAIAADPRNVYARIALARLRESMNAPDAEVRQILGDAIRQSPGESSPRLQLIQYLLSKRLYKDALVAAQEATVALPDDPSVIDAAGRAQAEAGDVEQAAKTFRRLASLNERSPLAYSRLADIYRAQGKREAALGALLKAWEIAPGDPSIQTDLVEQLMSGKKPQEAVSFARRIESERASLPDGYILEAMIQLRLKAPEAAAEASRKGLARAAGNPDLGRLLYKALQVSGRTAEGDRLASTWLKEHPDDSAFEFQVATTQLLRGNLAEAETRYRHVLARNPNNVLALNNLAWTLARQHKPGAATAAQHALELLPGHAYLYDTLADALGSENRLPEALQAQGRAVELEPTNASYRLKYAALAIKTGDKALARKELDRLKSTAAGSPIGAEATRLLQTL